MTGIRERVAAIVGELRVDEWTALAGVPVAYPREEVECRELFELAARDSLSVLPLGRGSKLDWTAPARTVDFALSTRELAGVLEFEAGDGTITARAGTPVAELRETVAAEGLELTPDVPRPAESTIGGVIAAGQSGPDRLGHGPVRGHLLGTRVLSPGGAATKSGGKLVKNATGYDLHRLQCGSFGTLGVILEVSLRLFPAPRAVAWVRADFGELSEALAAARRLRSAAVPARAMTIENAREDEREAPWALHLALAGFPEVLEEELDRLRRNLDFAELLEGEEARAAGERLRDLEPDARAVDVLHLAAPPSRLDRAAGTLLERFGAAGRAPAIVQPGVATIDLAIEPEDPEEMLASIATLRDALTPLSAHLSVRGPILRRAAIDPFGAPGPSFALQRRLRDALDPEGRLAGGRFLGGL